MKKTSGPTRQLGLVGALACSLVSGTRADVLLRSGSGATPAEIQNIVDVFKLDLGGIDNGEGASALETGYRTLDWDGVPDANAAPGLLPPDYYNSTSMRGAVLSPADTDFQVSASAASGLPLYFGTLDPSYSVTFTPFSGERLFTPLGSVTTEVQFFVPGDPTQPAYVRGFGVVFSDVDMMSESSIELFDPAGESLFTGFVPVSPNGGFSFLGLSFNAGEQVSRVRITSGNTALAAGVFDGGSIDVVTMDNVYFGEPTAVPEPASFALFAVGSLLTAGLRCRGRGRSKGGQSGGLRPGATDAREGSGSTH